jgi:hypothetical protein
LLFVTEFRMVQRPPQPSNPHTQLPD